MRAIIALLPALAILPLLGACSSAIPQGRGAKQTIRQSTAQFTPRPEARQCLASLGAARANFTPLPDQYFGSGCSTIGTVRLSGLRSDNSALALTNMGPVACPLAETFAAWARFGADRAAQQILGSPIARIETMGSYNCRNVAGTERRSAHSTANAIDISGFVLADGRRVTVLSGWTSANPAERTFLRTIHTSACKRFGTVLGPQYNAAHANHLHVELGGSDYCR